jgi:hypothetical protein
MPVAARFAFHDANAAAKRSQTWVLEQARKPLASSILDVRMPAGIGVRVCRRGNSACGLSSLKLAKNQENTNIIHKDKFDQVVQSSGKVV